MAAITIELKGGQVKISKAVGEPDYFAPSQIKSDPDSLRVNVYDDDNSTQLASEPFGDWTVGADSGFADSEAVCDAIAKLTKSTAGESGVVVIDGVEYTVNHDKISGNISGDNVLIAAAVGLKIRVLAIHYVCAGAVGVQFQDDLAGGSPVALTGVMPYAPNSGESSGINEHGKFSDGTINKPFVMVLDDAIFVDGRISWIEIA